MKGVIYKIWKNQTDDGKPYLVLKTGGEKYSVWDEKYMDGIEEGVPVEYESTQSGTEDSPGWGLNNLPLGLEVYLDRLEGG